jgi:hypothetical protein
MKALIIPDNIIKDKIYTIRGVQVMLDSDLAELYETSVKVLNQAVKRNIERFPRDFMFQLTEKEFKILWSQPVTANLEWNKNNSLRFQNGTLESKYLRSQSVTLDTGRGKHRKYLPYVFTEQGVSMLSGILHSKIAIRVSIQIMNAFVAMRKFISKNAEVFTRLDSAERKQLEFEIKTEENFEKVFDALQTEKPKQGIFYEGQIFDAYKFVCDLIRNAKLSIQLIDNYVDESVIALFSKRRSNVNVVIYTKNPTKQLNLDVKKFNSQYEPIEVKIFKNSHDRFLIIDKKDIYHFGASLKDLGKKWFAFSRFEKGAVGMLRKLES